MVTLLFNDFCVVTGMFMKFVFVGCPKSILSCNEKAIFKIKKHDDIPVL
jgi:hypothetical protein